MSSDVIQNSSKWKRVDYFLLLTIIFLCISIPTQQYWDTGITEDGEFDVSFTTNPTYDHKHQFNSETFIERDAFVIDANLTSNTLSYAYKIEADKKLIASQIYYLDISTITIITEEGEKLLTINIYETAETILIDDSIDWAIIKEVTGEIPFNFETINTRLQLLMTYDIINENGFVLGQVSYDTTEIGSYSQQGVDLLTQAISQGFDNQVIRYNENIPVDLLEIVNILLIALIGVLLMISMKKKPEEITFSFIRAPFTEYLRRNAFIAVLIMVVIQNLIHFYYIYWIPFILLNFIVVFADLFLIFIVSRMEHGDKIIREHMSTNRDMYVILGVLLGVIPISPAVRFVFYFYLIVFLINPLALNRLKIISEDIDRRTEADAERYKQPMRIIT